MAEDLVLQKLNELGDSDVIMSPFLSWSGKETVSELFTGRSFAMGESDRALLSEFKGRALDSVSSGARSSAFRWEKDLLVLTRKAYRSIRERMTSLLDIEASGHCNASCSFCPREAIQHSRGFGQMTPELFQRIADALVRSHSIVTFCGIGEPTLNPNLPSYIRLSKQIGARTVLVTNGSRLSLVLLRKLLRSGLDTLNISFSEMTSDAYGEIYRGLNYESVKENIITAARYAGGRIPINILAVRTKGSKCDFDKFSKEWISMGVRVVIMNCHSRGGAIPNPALVTSEAQPDSARCGLFNTASFITWSGDLLPCCHDVRASHSLGNVLTDDLEAILDRKLITILGQTLFPFCKGCDEPLRELKFWPGRAISRDASSRMTNRPERLVLGSSASDGNHRPLVECLPD